MLGKNPFNKNRDEICAVQGLWLVASALCTALILKIDLSDRFMIYMVFGGNGVEGKKGALCAPCKIVVNQKKRRQEWNVKNLKNLSGGI